MAAKPINQRKLRLIHRYYLQPTASKLQTAKALNISRNTLQRYLSKCSMLNNLNPESFTDFKVFIAACKAETETVKHHVTSRQMLHQFKSLIPHLIDTYSNQGITVKGLWRAYIAINPMGYRYSQFAYHFCQWRTEHTNIVLSPYPVKKLPEEDIATLKQWRNSVDRRKWERAVTLLEHAKGTSVAKISQQVERSVGKVEGWITQYQAKGLTSLQKKPKKLSSAVVQQILTKKSNLIKLIHETPKLHGINRTSWKLADLSAIYYKLYGQPLSATTISAYLRQQGFVFRKAREVLTSPDPQFRHKLAHITSILSGLKLNERFFSIDEYGPFAVKMKGGRSLVRQGEQKTYPQLQKSKGFLICTAALELSSNQVTHFYSAKKDTEEMIKLIDVLLVQYRNQDKLYFSWDAASWHASKKLYEHLEHVNSEQYRAAFHTPIVELAPLPASAQFLNVIESVFSGLAKAIIHNSNYESVTECKAAIDHYFNERNSYFQANPKRAGELIWGQELVKPVFRDDQNCKDPNCR